MPKRSNKFQRFVHLVHSQLANCKVVESAIFVDRRSGEKREVDIALFSEIATYPVVIGIECRDHKRPQSSTWVEEMWAKHQALPTTSLILVSSSGFYEPALKTAEALGIEALTFEQATERDWPNTLPKLRRFRVIEIWKTPVRFTLVPDEAWFPRGMQASALAKLPVFAADGTNLGTLKTLFDEAIDSVRLEPFNHFDILENASFDADCHLRLPTGAYLEEERGRARRKLREIIFRLHFETFVRDAEPRMYRFKDAFLVSLESSSAYAEIVYSLVTNREGQASSAASIAEWRYRPSACQWDVAVPVEYFREGLGEIPILSYEDPNQFKSSDEPSPDLPKLSLDFKILRVPSGNGDDEVST